MTIDELLTKLEDLMNEGGHLEDILEASVEGLHGMDPRFDWTGIYELFPDDTLRLGPFIGSPTDHVFIGVGQGVCGAAIAQKRNMNIPDVRTAANYLACSAETRAELVVLIRDGDRIYGQIDIDSHTAGAFDDPCVDKVQRVADALAHAYETRHAESS
jgi:GAF domain-containing protein